MEEDLKIIKKIIYDKQGKRMNYIDIYNVVDNECNDFIQAIENLIARNKELEKLLDDRLWNEHIHKETDKMWRNKIKEKIEEVFDILDTKPYTAYTLYGDELFDSSDIKEVLQELLEEN